MPWRGLGDGPDTSLTSRSQVEIRPSPEHLEREADVFPCSQRPRPLGRGFYSAEGLCPELWVGVEEWEGSYLVWKWPRLKSETELGQMLALPLTNCVRWVSCFTLPQFPHLHKGDKAPTSWDCVSIKWVRYVKCMARGRHSVLGG